MCVAGAAQWRKHCAGPPAQLAEQGGGQCAGDQGTGREEDHSRGESQVAIRVVSAVRESDRSTRFLVFKVLNSAAAISQYESCNVQVTDSIATFDSSNQNIINYS